MQTLHSANGPRLQAGNKANLATVNISILDDDTLDARIIPSPDYERRSTSAWQPKLNAAPDEKIALHAIINEWLTGCYDARIALGWLYALQLLQEPQEADCYETMCSIAFFELGPVALPERRTAPIPSVSRAEPFAPGHNSAATERDLAFSPVLREAFDAAKRDIADQLISDADFESMYRKTRSEMLAVIEDYESASTAWHVVGMLGGPAPVVTPADYKKKSIPAKLRWAVFKRDQYRCVQCASEEDLTADHIRSEATGGETTFENLQTLCRRCNAKKGA